MWQCDNCGYTDEDGTTFEEETEESLEDAVRYCPECGSDEVFLVDEEEDLSPPDEEDLEPEKERGEEKDEDDEDLGEWEDSEEEDEEVANTDTDVKW